MSEVVYDVVILGAGPGGYVAAIRAAQLGLKVAVVEKDRAGGVCLNVGCIPSKSLIHQADLYAESLSFLAKAGVAVDTAGFSYEAVFKASRLASDRLSKGVQYLLKKNGVELVQGTGSVTDARHILVKMADGERVLEGKALILATGSRPRSIPGFEIDEGRFMSSTGMLMSPTLPKRLVILGAGAIGMEFAHITRSFGVEVTVVELLDQVLPLEDAETAAVVAKSFASRGIRILTSTKAAGATAGPDGVAVSLTLPDGTATTVEADRVLVSVGRAPNTDGIGLEKLGLTLTRGYIETGDWFETQVAGVYAIGDITTMPQLAHVASKAGEIAVEHIASLLKGTPEPAESRIGPYEIPAAVYCKPEVASFGLQEKKAKERAVRHQVARFPFRGVGKAVATEAPDGQVKLIFNPDSGAVLGASIVGAGATDTIHELLLAARSELSVEEVADMIHAHPTLAEGVMEAAKAALGHAIHA